jgi:hypothetical protein
MTAEFDDFPLAHRDVARRFELVALTSALTETTPPVLAWTNCSLTGLPVRALGHSSLIRLDSLVAEER